MSHTKGALEHPSFANSLVTELNAAGGSIPGNKTVFFSHLCIKTNILPRQARDKHRENSKKDRFVQSCWRRWECGRVFFLSSFPMKNDRFCQDRLRTNMEKVEEKRIFRRRLW